MKLGVALGTLALPAVLALGAPAATEKPADLVLKNGAVYTMDASRSWAEAVAVRGGRIAYVGTSEGARAFTGPSTRVVDLAGKMVLPAFHDAHVHPVSGGMELAQCNLNGLDSKEKVFEAIRKYARSASEGAVGPGGRLGPAPLSRRAIRHGRSSTRSCRTVRRCSPPPTATLPGRTRRRSRSRESRSRRPIPRPAASSGTRRAILPARCARRPTRRSRRGLPSRRRGSTKRASRAVSKWPTASASRRSSKPTREARSWRPTGPRRRKER